VLVWFWTLLMLFPYYQPITCRGRLVRSFLSAYQSRAVIPTRPTRRLRFGWFRISRQVLSFLLFSYRRGLLWFPRVVVRGVGQVFNHLPGLGPQANRRFKRTLLAPAFFSLQNLSVFRSLLFNLNPAPLKRRGVSLLNSKIHQTTVYHYISLY